MQTQKIQIKLYAKDPSAVRPAAFVPVFHEWIKQGALPELLIDVVDYAHVHQGPSVLLVGHESDYAIDFGEGHPGVMYSRKRGGPADAVDGIVEALRRALAACKRLEDEPSFTPKLAFSGAHIEIRLNDRCVAPNDEATFTASRPLVEAALKRIFGESPFMLERVSNDPRELLTFSARAEEAPGVRELLARVA
jgi:hypothetical protein